MLLERKKRRQYEREQNENKHLPKGKKYDFPTFAFVNLCKELLSLVFQAIETRCMDFGKETEPLSQDQMLGTACV